MLKNEHLSIIEIWLRALVTQTLRLLPDSAALAERATAIELHFPGQFADLVQLLRAASVWLGSGRDAAALVRMDPDVAKTLTAMFPPEEVRKGKGKRKRGKRVELARHGA